MNNIKKSPHSAEYKFKVEMEAIKGEKTTAQLCGQYGIAKSTLLCWKKALLEQGSRVFAEGNVSKHTPDEEIEKLHATIGRLKVENDFLSKVLGKSR